jgi:hypothetical protein
VKDTRKGPSVPENDPFQLILAEADVTRRMLLLTELQSTLAAQGAQSVLARRHRIVLRADQPIGPSGLTNPELHIFAPGGTYIATTDGTTYRLASGPEYPVDDPAGAAIATLTRHPIHRRA